MYLKGKIKFASLPAAICLMVFIVDANAQRQSQPATTQTAIAANKQTNEETKNADLAITATVTARELKFDVVPNPTVEFTGRPERKTVWEADRQNLPRPVEPGVTYRNIGIQLRITSRFADIEQIVAEALGEIPISEDAPANQNQPQNSGSAPPVVNKIPLPNNQNKKP
ncbi:MAG: hypothetical protein M3033_14690 [Acidobacteriota bacterium]|nr:hypothetical protein [Acidobacteriota bacterium]